MMQEGGMMADNRHKLGVRVTRESIKRVRDEFNAIQDKIDTRLKNIIGETGLKIHGDTVRSAPVKTGSLKTSYQVDLSNIDKDEASVYTEIEYAPNVEYGFGQRPQPHFNPAIEKHQERFYRAVDKLIKQSIE